MLLGPTMDGYDQLVWWKLTHTTYVWNNSHNAAYLAERFEKTA
jgi:hypothetical protein